LNTRHLAMGLGVVWSTFFTGWTWFQLLPVLDVEPTRAVDLFGFSTSVNAAIFGLWVLPAMAAMCALRGISAERSVDINATTLVAAACLVIAMTTSVMGQALVHAAYIECPDHQMGRIAFAVASAVMILIGGRFSLETRSSSQDARQPESQDLSFAGLAGFILFLTGGVSGVATLTLPIDPLILVSTSAIAIGILACAILGAAHRLFRATI